MLVYLTDDDVGMRELLSVILTTAGHMVRATADPTEVLTWVAAGTIPDLIVTDFEMRPITGGSLTRLLRRDGYRGGIMIVSGLQFDTPPTGVDHVFRKPLDIQDFLRQVETLNNTSR